MNTLHAGPDWDAVREALVADHPSDPRFTAFHAEIVTPAIELARFLDPAQPLAWLEPLRALARRALGREEGVLPPRVELIRAVI
ncbi:MAG: hypothetical protein R3F20_19645, partial [Planctomycetota bacterium]